MLLHMKSSLIPSRDGKKGTNYGYGTQPQQQNEKQSHIVPTEGRLTSGASARSTVGSA